LIEEVKDNENDAFIQLVLNNSNGLLIPETDVDIEERINKILENLPMHNNDEEDGVLLMLQRFTAPTILLAGCCSRCFFFSLANGMFWVPNYIMNIMKMRIVR
jgi:hypothetical protein